MINESKEYILAKYDVSGIQDYIFASNRLREIAGASHQVTKILKEFLYKDFRETDTRVILEWEQAESLQLPDNETIMAEIVYIGGGNAIILFRDVSLFREIGERLGAEIASHSVGIDLMVAFIKTALNDFTKDRQELDRNMSQLKRKSKRQLLYSPFPVVEQDPASHQPITCSIDYGGGQEDMTQIQFQKRTAYQGIGNLGNLFPTVTEPYGYPEDIDQLCRKHGENSQIAVVHIDGNGMGERINQRLKKEPEYISGVQTLRQESQQIASLFQSTYADVLQILLQSQILLDEQSGNGKRMLPLRPIILDGDDFTFLCRAELAVPIAAGFMAQLMQRQPDGQKITACGGIAVVHSHFPFRTAYAIAEESCAKAKKKWYQAAALNKSQTASCYLDFQIIKGSEIETAVESSCWQQRPYSIGLSPQEPAQDALSTLYNTMVKMKRWPSGRLHKLYRMIQRNDQGIDLLKREFFSRGYDLSELAGVDWENSTLVDALELQGLCHMDLWEKFINIQ